jgi:4-amino-4-deoxy-L-arabinose transferase-like glycosyltransferase
MLNSPADSQVANSPSSRKRLILPALLLAIYLGQCVWFSGTQSFTLDEPGHIAAGLAMWKYGRFVIQNDNPPLERKIATAPLHFLTNVDVDNQQLNPNALPPGLQPRHIWYVRLPIVGLGVLLGAALWWVSYKLFSQSAAAFALALFAFSPAMIAHFSLATTDGAGVLTFFLGIVAFAVWVDSPTWRNALLLGAAVGAMLLAKFYAGPIVAAMLLLMSLDALRRKNLALIKQAALAAALGYLIVCFGYNLHIAHFQFSNGIMDAHFQHREHDWITPVPFNTSFSIYLPGGDYIDGLARVFRTNDAWRHSYLFGRISEFGFFGYHFWAIVLKWPTLILLLSAIGSILAVRKRASFSRGFWLAAILPVTFFALTVNARLQIGDRHVLPLYPFLLLLAAGVWEWAQRAGNKKWVLVLVSCAVLNAADVLRYAPDYLSYFTPLVRPTQTWRYLGDSNIDWGQGMFALKKYQDEHPNETLYVRTFGGVDPSFYGIRCQTFAESDRPHGTVIVTAVDMAGYDLSDHQAMQWLWQHPLKGYLNHTLFVFDAN